MKTLISILVLFFFLFPSLVNAEVKIFTEGKEIEKAMKEASEHKQKKRKSSGRSTKPSK